MIFGNARYWTFQLCGWGILLAVHSFFAWSFGKLQTSHDVVLFVGRIGIFALLGFVLSHLMRMVILGVNLLQQKLERQLAAFVGITLGFSLVSAFYYVLLLQHFNFLTDKEIESIDQSGFIPITLINGFTFFMFYFIWNLIYFMYHYVAKSQRQQLDTLQLESMVKELELKTIKAHINPHFIFNSLNSIRALVDENPQRARRAITELSNILRSSISSDKSETVRLDRELAIVKDYLALETMRFEDRLQVEYDIDAATLERPVPPMMLQTLVENAIKHGISKRIDGGSVKVISKILQDQHLLSVQNTGQLDAKEGEGGFGLSSTRDRLQLLFGDKGNFTISQLNSETVEARILMPLQVTLNVMESKFRPAAQNWKDIPAKAGLE